MKSSSNLFPNTSSAKKMEELKKEQQSEKQTSSHLSEEERMLVKEIRDRGDKITEEDVIFIIRDRNGKIRWLEKGHLALEGKKASGLAHIVDKHASHFNDKGIPTDMIPSAIKQTVEEAKIIGKSGMDRVVYETIINGKVVHIAITISDNGYIVGAHPVSIKKGKK